MWQWEEWRLGLYATRSFSGCTWLRSWRWWCGTGCMVKRVIAVVVDGELRNFRARAGRTRDTGGCSSEPSFDVPLARWATWAGSPCYLVVVSSSEVKGMSARGIVGLCLV